MNIEQHISLATKTTFKIGGLAAYYIEVENKEGLRAALSYAQIKKLPVFVLGGGSNVLISDAGFSGVVIKNNIKGIVFDEYPKTVDCIIGSGEVWDEVVAKTVEKGLQGIESLSLIPGTMGGAIVQNIGAYGSEIKDVCVSVDVMDVQTGEVRKVDAEHCQFGYRTSFLKTAKGKNFIVVSATLRLNKETLPVLNYKDIQEYFSKKEIAQPSLQEVRDAVINIRTLKLPDISKVGTAGSFFKNPVVTKSFFNTLKIKYPEMPSFVAPTVDGIEYVKIPLAWIVDKVCGLKGYRQGDAGVYDKQAIVLVNYGSATKKDIDLLAAHIAREVFEKTGIIIEREVESV